MYQLFESIKIALAAIWANKLRSFLTVLGNIVAVTSIIAVVSLVQGIDDYVSDAIVSELGLGDMAARLPPGHMVALPATEIALKHLGRPLPNAVLLGGFAALTGLITLDAVVHAIHDKFKGPVAARNAAAATEAHDLLAVKETP